MIQYFRRLYFLNGSDGKESACSVGDLGLLPGSGRSPGEENPLQYSCLKNSTYRGAWWAIAHGVTKSQTQLRDCHKHSSLRQMIIIGFGLFGIGIGIVYTQLQFLTTIEAKN